MLDNGWIIYILNSNQLNSLKLSGTVNKTKLVRWNQANIDTLFYAGLMLGQFKPSLIDLDRRQADKGQA